MDLEQRIIDKEKVKIETSIDERYTPQISKPAPWGTIAKIKLERIKESLDVKITYHKKNIIWCCILLAISLGIYIYVPCICKVLCTTNNITEFSEILFFLFIPPVGLLTTLPLIIAIILTVIGIRKGRGIIELSHSHLSVDLVEADYFEIPHDKFSDDIHRALLVLVEGANKENIIWGETTAGEAFNNYVSERVKQIEREKKRLEQLKRKNPLLYSIETMDYADEIKTPEQTVIQVKAPEPKKETVTVTNGTVYAGINGDFSLCVGCLRADFCRRVNCSGFVPKK